MRRIDEDTVVLKEKSVKISELQVELEKVKGMNVLAHGIGDRLAKLPADVQPYLIYPPLHDSDVAYLENQIAELSALPIEQ